MKLVEVTREAVFTGHKDCVYALENGGSEKEFFTSGAEGMVVLWNLDDSSLGNMVAKVANSVYALCYLNESKQILVGQNFEGVHLIDVENKKEIHSANITDSYIFDIKVCDKYIYVTCGNGFFIILSRSDLTVVSRVKLSDKSCRTMAVNPNLGVYALGFSDNSIKIFSFKKNQLLFNIYAHQNSIFTLAFSNDGRFLFSGSRDAHLKVWDCENDFSLYKSIVAHMFAINNIQFNDDGTLFATCSMDKSIKIWDAHNLTLLKVIDKARFAGHGTSVNKLLWKSNSTILSASDDKNIVAWNLKF